MRCFNEPPETSRKRNSGEAIAPPLKQCVRLIQTTGEVLPGEPISAIPPSAPEITAGVDIENIEATGRGGTDTWIGSRIAAKALPDIPGSVVKRPVLNVVIRPTHDDVNASRSP